jgi:hypothetical protein
VAVLAIAAVLVASAPLCAQVMPGVGSEAATTLPRSALEDLPSSGTLGGLLETTVPELISDRIDGGGLSVGRESRLGARGGSWTQTAFQFDDLDVTDAGAFGGSLLFLDPGMLETVETTTAMMPIERSAPGLHVHLIPRRPSDTWQGRAELLSAPWAATPAAAPIPSIAALRTWNRIAASVSGPLRRDRVSTVLGITVTDATRFERADPTRLRSQETGAFAEVLFTASADDEVFGAVAGRSARVPLDGRLWIGQPDARQRVSDLLIASHWHHRARRVSLTAAAAVGHATVNLDRPAVPLAYIDSIQDMPIVEAVTGSTSGRRWSAALREAGLASMANRWLRGGRAGVEIGGRTASESSTLASAVAETVERVPARMWRLASTTTEPRHHDVTVTGYVAETIPLSSRFTIEGGVRWEGVTAAADGGETIRWSDWFPRVSLRWNILPQQHLSGVLGLGRYGDRLPREALAAGDPASTSAQVFRWIDRNGDGRFENGEEGPLVARVGDDPMGTSMIDADLKRPYLDELLVGLELQPAAGWTLRLVGLTRQDRRPMALVNTGVPIGSYAATSLPDPGADLLDPSDDQQLPVYDRRPGAFDADEYVLTNPVGLTTTFDGLDLSVGHSGDRLQMMAGATAGRSSGPAASRGFTVFENDGALLGDVLSDPNASTFARGSFFSDRNYTIKTSGTYRFPHGVRLGLVARYQDGQSFSRLAVVPNLGQGTEAIRAYRNGRTRFAYTLTLDARAQIGFHLGRQRLAVVWDAFNLLNLSNEVEESVATGPAFRVSTALQPPRAIHLGVRVAF